MENSQDIQSQIFSRIRDQLPGHVSLVDEVADILGISNDSAYRRDVEASELAGEAVYVDALRNKEKFPYYFRADLKFNYRLNTPRYTHEVGLDLINVTDHPNILKQIYIHGAEDPLREVRQLGFLPLFYDRIDI